MLTAVALAGSLAAAPAGNSPLGTAPAAAAPVPAAVKAAAPRGSFTVGSTHLGIHANHARPSVPTGSLRLNCFPLWSEVHTGRGQFNWGPMDAIVDRAVDWGYRDIMFTFCGTPRWAGGPVRTPRREVLGPWSTSAPKNLDDWSAFVSAVVDRYKGRITHYQAWNEPTTDQFFQGTPKQMAAMTKRLNDIVARQDPNATVVAASLQQVNKSMRDWGYKYLKELKALRWPVEVFSFQGYSSSGVPDGRQSVISGFKRQLRSLRAPNRQVWDTEITYKATRGRLTANRQGALVIRSYLDGWRMGVRRTYWYAWTDGPMPFGGVRMSPGTVPAAALDRFGSKVIGARYTGCKESSNGLVRCTFTRDGGTFTILWSERKPVTVRRTTSTSYQDLVTGATAAGRSIRVADQPLLVNGRV